jgi:hypothetical protein
MTERRALYALKDDALTLAVRSLAEILGLDIDSLSEAEKRQLFHEVEELMECCDFAELW